MLLFVLIKSLFSTSVISGCCKYWWFINFYRIPLYRFKTHYMSSLSVTPIFLINMIVKSVTCMRAMRWFPKYFHLTNEDTEAKGWEVTWLRPLWAGCLAVTSRHTRLHYLLFFSLCCVTWMCLSFPKCSVIQSFSKFSICAEL